MKKFSFIGLILFIVLSTQTQTTDSINLTDTAKLLITEKVDSLKNEKIKELNKNINAVNQAQQDLDSVANILDSLKDLKKYKWKLAPVKLGDIKKITFKNGKKDINLFIYYKQIDGKYYFYKIVKK